MIATVSKHKKPSSAPKIELPPEPHLGQNMKAQDFLDGFPDGSDTLGVQIGETKRGRFIMRIEEFDPEGKDECLKVICVFLQPFDESEKLWTPMTTAEVSELDMSVQDYNEGKYFELCPYDPADETFFVSANKNPLYLHFIPIDKDVK